MLVTRPTLMCMDGMYVVWFHACPWGCEAHGGRDLLAVMLTSLVGCSVASERSRF